MTLQRRIQYKYREGWVSESLLSYEEKYLGHNYELTSICWTKSAAFLTQLSIPTERTKNETIVATIDFILTIWKGNHEDCAIGVVTYNAFSSY